MVPGSMHYNFFNNFQCFTQFIHIRGFGIIYGIISVLLEFQYCEEWVGYCYDNNLQYILRGFTSTF